MKQSKKSVELRMVILIGWCLLFLRCKSTDTNMVRAVVLAKNETGYHVGLLYHFQEPTADSADVEEQLNMVWSDADTLERAFAKAEEQLLEPTNYRLCDYLFLPVDTNYELMSDYEKLVLDKKCGRIAAHVSFLDLSFGEIEPERWLEKGAFRLLEIATEHKKEMPYLYQWDELCLLPLFQIENEADITKSGAVLCSNPQRYFLGEEEESVLRLLMGQSNGESLWLDEARLSIRKCVVSVTIHPGSVDLVLDCQPSYGTNAPTQTQILQLRDLCTEIVYDYWNRGVDLLSLKEKSALQRGVLAAISPEKNVCPQLQTDVRFLMI